MNISGRLIERISKHEGFRAKPYKCSAGKLTIGFGRNLEDVGISREEAEYLLVGDILKAMEQAEKQYFFRELNEARKEVVIEMIFNMGIGNVLKFTKMIKAINERNWDKASIEMLNSAWAKQVGERANVLAKIMRFGE